MNTAKFSLPAIIILFALLILYRYNFAPQSQEVVEDINVATTSKNIQMANPASKFCIDKGGKSVIQTREDGAQYGLCYFDDARACEEWVMMRGECPVGGVKTAGYDTIDQKFCAWSGGNTVAEKDSKCTFANGKVCLTLDFYNGTCTRY